MSTRCSYFLIGNQHWYHDGQCDDYTVCIEIDDWNIDKVESNFKDAIKLAIKKDSDIGVFLLEKMQNRSFVNMNVGFALVVSDTTGNVILSLMNLRHVRGQIEDDGYFLEISNDDQELYEFADELFREFRTY